MGRAERLSSSFHSPKDNFLLTRTLRASARVFLPEKSPNSRLGSILLRKNGLRLQIMAHYNVFYNKATLLHIVINPKTFQHLLP